MVRCMEALRTHETVHCTLITWDAPVHLFAAPCSVVRCLTRCIHLEPNSLENYTTAATPTQYLLHAGQFLNGLAGPVAMSTPPVVSSLFFPPNQRATATSIMAVSNYLGVALTFLVGPLLIPNKPKLASRTTGRTLRRLL